MIMQDSLFWSFLKKFFFVWFYRQLIAHLQVFSKFSNPRALYLEQKLNALYTQVMLFAGL